jgi:hypothetical protein
MGFIQPKRIQVKLLKPDLALALTWWSVSFPNSKQMVVENTTMDLQSLLTVGRLYRLTRVRPRCNWAVGSVP